MRLFRKISAVLIVSSLAFRLQAQHLGPWKGTLVFNDNTDLKCTFTLNPFRNEEIFLVRADSVLYEYKISEVKSFSYFDTDIKMIRYFKNFTLKIKGDINYKHRFLEEIHRTDRISILEGRDIIIKVYTDDFNQPVGKTRIKEKTPRYLLDHRDSTAYPLSIFELKRITQDKKDEIKYFVKKKKLTLLVKNIDEYIAVIEYYSSLKPLNSVR